jgi:FAD/FMN-containing dehydrogenase
MLNTRYLDHYIEFDEQTGLLTCAAGVSLDDIVQTFVPKGWFLSVTPGTRFVTVGGAIASDVHGKNHHLDGSFCDHVMQMDLLLGNGEKVSVSPMVNADLFHATCGGMGLTGLILSATFRLKSIRSSDMLTTTIKAADIDALLDAFEENQDASYSVAWIDCLARGKNLGRSLLMLGEHADEGPLAVKGKRRIPVPVDMPANLLNPYTVKLFNAAYFHRIRQSRISQVASLESFFYPLDTLDNWNRLYGRKGFIQYQFVLPKSDGIIGLKKILERISQSGMGSFLAVLKVFGKGNNNMLSFPKQGYTLALDFKVEPKAFELLNELDELVLDEGGRLYLAKDARMGEAAFKTGYSRWSEFESVRERYHAIGAFSSEQSRRLGLR